MNHFLGSIEYDLILVFIGILLFRMVFLKLYMSEKERIIVELQKFITIFLSHQQKQIVAHGVDHGLEHHSILEVQFF